MRALGVWLFLISVVAASQTHTTRLPARAAEDAQTRFRGTTFGALVEKNGAKLPSSLNALRLILDSTGEVADSVIPFSDAPAPTSLEEPRLVYATEDRSFFVAAIPRVDGSVDVEFISRNLTTRKFEFGVIRDFGKPNATVEFPPRGACTSCHKNEGPIFREFPWSNSAGASFSGHVVARAFVHTLATRDEKFEPLRSLMEEEQKKNADVHAFDASVATFLEANEPLRRWNGADLGRVTRDAGARELERRVVFAHRETVLTDYIDGLPNAPVKSSMIEYILRTSLAPETRRPGPAPLSLLDFKDVPSNRTPLLSNINPGRVVSAEEVEKRAEKLKKVAQDLHAILAANEMVKDKSLEIFPPEQRANHSSQLVKPYVFQEGSEPVSPLESGIEGSIIAYGNGISERWRKEPRVTLDRLMKTKALRAHVEAGRLPFSGELNQSVLAGIAELRGQAQKDQAVSVPPAVKPRALTKTTCLDCHGGQVSGLRFEFDPHDSGEWKKRLESRNAKTVEETLEWRKKIKARIDDGTMPPPDTLPSFDKDALEALKKNLAGAN